MRGLALSMAMLLSVALPCQAVEIRVLAPGLVGLGINTLADRWSAQTGNKVIFPAPMATVSKIQKLVESAEAYDLVLLPTGELTAESGKLKTGSQKPVGRVVFGLAVKAGAPHPDISTPEKFRAALRGKTVAYNDPASGSMAGRMVDALMKQPAYAGIKAAPHKNPAADAVAAGEREMAVAVVSEEVPIAGIEVVSPIPAIPELELDVSGAVLDRAPHAAEAASFLAYITRPETAAMWSPTGIALIKP